MIYQIRKISSGGKAYHINDQEGTTSYFIAEPRTSITRTPCLTSVLSGLSRSRIFFIFVFSVLLIFVFSVLLIFVFAVPLILVRGIMMMTSQLIEGEISLPSKAEMEADWKSWVARNKVASITNIISIVITNIITNTLTILITMASSKIII